VSRINESLRSDLDAPHEAGVIGKVTMREFDAICPPPVREFNAADIKRLRESLKFSQPVFAHHLHTSASTVRKWEQGETRPAGPALKLLNVIADKGLQAII
jgi:putative transcriptional regulator